METSIRDGERGRTGRISCEGNGEGERSGVESRVRGREDKRELEGDGT